MKDKIISKLRGNNKLETAENYSILFILIGAIIFSLGIGLNVISTKGASAIFAMLGALTSFISTISLIVVWIMKEFEKKDGE